ncbi:MAG: hypothetical protein HY814_13110 [Candidatus Riflebacteria bacterium]|nr:hypothetical protein [Candidatus Riflebacteria bacterium]
MNRLFWWNCLALLLIALALLASLAQTPHMTIQWATWGGFALFGFGLAMLLSQRTDAGKSALDVAARLQVRRLSSATEAVRQAAEAQGQATYASLESLTRVLQSQIQAQQRVDSISSACQKSLELTRDGTETLHRAGLEMASIDEHVARISNTFQRLEEQLHGIRSVVNLVTQAAGHTKNIALNAEIAAARNRVKKDDEEDNAAAATVLARDVRRLASELSEAAETVEQLSRGLEEAQGVTQDAIREGLRSAQVTREEAGRVEAAIGSISEATRQSQSGVQDLRQQMIGQRSELDTVSTRLSEMHTALVQTLAALEVLLKAKDDLLAGLEPGGHR